MDNILLVPMQVNALALPAARTVAAPMADFSRLPWSDGTRDYNADVANVGESIAAQPFESSNFTLKPGFHLHWLLPKGLCGAVSNDETSNGPHSEMLRVPNRWLVTRRNGRQVESWVVESDYLAPDGTGNGVSYPFTPDPNTDSYRPFRSLGRAVPYEAWSPNTAERLDRLTAAGYGEPAFAAFYPNCFSVFGFHDNQSAANIPPGLEYEVIGWYSDPAQDELHRFIIGFQGSFESQAGHPPTAEETRAAVEEAFGWTYAVDKGNPPPEHLVCFGRVTFPDGGAPKENDAMEAEVGLAIGETGIGALSAYTSAEINTDYQAIIEEQLVAMSMDSELGHHLMDMGPKFEEACHQMGFNALDSGPLFTMRAIATDGGGTNPTSVTAALPDAIADKLNATNVLQTTFNEAEAQIKTLRKQTYTDWVKYMLAAHPELIAPGGLPPSDAIRAFLQTRSIPEIAIQEAAAGTGVELRTDNTGDVTGASARQGSSDDSLSARLADSINGLVSTIDEVNQGAPENGLPVWALQSGAAPPYFQPTEPVVLLTGDAVASTGLQLNDGPLSCRVLTVDTPPVPGALAKIRNAIEVAAEAGGIGFNTWTEQPWFPFLLEWSVEVFPTSDGGNLTSPDATYQPDFIEGSYMLTENAVDLATQPDCGAVVSGACVYRGSSLLSSYAGDQLMLSVTDFLMEQDDMLNAFYAANDVPEEDQNAVWVVANIDTLQTWYETDYRPDETPEQRAEDPVYTAICALGILPQLPSLSQSLSGFNDALLMHKQTLELSVEDPLAFAAVEPFIAAVRTAAGQTGGITPRPAVGFNPIRTGALRIYGLRLVGTYGRLKEVPVKDITPVTAMSLDGDERLFRLAPRLSQPARLDLQFRSAMPGGVEDGVETTTRPATNPICGWLLLNRLEQSIAVYDASGAALGVVACGGGPPWEAAPGGYGVEADAIENPTLQRVVQNLLEGGPAYRPAFYAAVASALGAIVPNGLTRAQGLAMLASRPLAVARAGLGLELQGLPAVSQSWNALRQDMRSDARKTDNFTGVSFPVRLGDARQLNDGLGRLLGRRPRRHPWRGVPRPQERRQPHGAHPHPERWAGQPLALYRRGPGRPDHAL